MKRSFTTLATVLGIGAALALAPAVPVFADDTATESAEQAAQATTLAVISLEGSIVERTDPMALFGSDQTTIKDIVSTINKAATDDEVGGLAIKLNGASMGMTAADSIRAALMDFRASGKPLVAASDTYGLGTYYLASTADEIVGTPVGGVDIMGMGFSMYYFKELLAKIGVEFQVVNTGKFKNAMEPFTHTGMTAGTREQMGALLEDLSAYMVAGVAEARGMSEDEAAAMLWEGPYTAPDALEAGLLTRLDYIDDFLAAYAADNGMEIDEDYTAVEKEEPKPFNLFTMFSNVGKGRDGAKKGAGEFVAVVRATGAITDGRSDGGLFGATDGIASDDFLDLLDKVAEEGDLKAIVLRVDSPGGSAIASDRIWNRLERFRADGIPVIASMGGVAASGGYYIAMGADKIYAEPTTITGSIGVIGGRPVLGGTYEKIGVDKDTLSIGRHAELFDEASHWDDEQVAVVERMIDMIYEDFTRKAAAGRNVGQDRIKELGGGRVWSGIAAVNNGLVDELGGFEDALAEARRLAGDESIKVIEFPKEQTLMDLIEEVLSGNRAAARAAVARSGLLEMVRTSPEWALVEAALPEAARNTLLTGVQLMSAGNAGGPVILMYQPIAFELR